MVETTKIKNAQVSGGKWVEMHAQEVTWTLDVFTSIPTTPNKTGIPAHEGDFIGLDNPGITIKGLIDMSDLNQINFKLLEQYAQTTGPTLFQDFRFTSGTTSIHTGSIWVMIKQVQASHTSNRVNEIPYNMILQTTSGT